VTKGAGDEGFFHISDHLLFLSVAYLTGFAIHESSSQFIIASLANFGGKRDLMGFVGSIQTFNHNLEVLAIFVLAEFAVFDIHLE
jgi:hypothetical protein